jgi:hypothetical protein
MRCTQKFAVVVVLFSALSGFGQSLGDLARTQRQKQANDTHAPHKVLTNEDMPAQPDAAPVGAAGDEPHGAPAPPPSNDEHAAAHWKAAIQAQMNTVASLQSRINSLNSSIHFVEADRYYNGVQHNERQLKKQEDVERMQKQLDEQKKQLEDMQEQAHKAGLGSSVYEP